MIKKILKFQEKVDLNLLLHFFIPTYINPLCKNVKILHYTLEPLTKKYATTFCNIKIFVYNINGSKNSEKLQKNYLIEANWNCQAKNNLFNNFS